MNQGYRITVVDDDRTMRESLSHLLESAGFEVVCLSRPENVLACIQKQDADVLLCDVRMPGMSGTELQMQLKGQTNVPIVLMSAHGDIPMAVSAIQNGAYSFLEKPFDPRRLIKLLENASQLRRLTRNADRLKTRLAELSGLDRVMIGNAPSIKALRAEIVDLSTTDVNVMLLGETGTGKELVAKALHDLGHRSGEPFVPLNCAAVPVTRFEEMLFGTAENGPGLLAQAEGGTLFLDELGAIPLEVQAKLLRVIETKQYTPIDTSKTINADIRILSAAHERLEDMMKEGTFREDLYFRLNTIMLTMPPLRARRDDITTLYMHYLDVFAATYETETPTLTSGDVARLLAYDWPGNVRELRNVCERHVLAARRGAGSVDSALNDNRDSLEAPETLREAVAAFERQLIGKALARHQGRMDDVATGLGIGRRTLNEKIVKLGLDKETILNS
ncbi:sigma-54 dependent transcriptional regulator [Hoeflea sp. EC-HK425]|uniref:sigma-54-dependent transcriptional regulator n=1 Tax=Hoeflea sp. EC-HK425 TaxID=2038388 RepID=UPI00125C251A|nr:sigma-54 dependent transcriptional regulator [Hoeflea sp. EC-HK425]VVT09321.1 Response regulator [Hoeflea sp. EC-HK425]